ncbi:hypothetical protein KUTeg_011042 [Tegillarca granosa]|uniref:C2H2-type domain-containing protein n=1 Tax=Tegillarca granosa TaxID=220873 RepID=A0ABQ9F5Y7_TEGGR|nr:hypothetical protein KUTeg_011042 [Tegillarca granosa]
MEASSYVISKTMETNAMSTTLKNSVQEICTKLSTLGEETFFLSVNLKDYSSTCFGSAVGKEFFMTRLDVIAQFYDYCKVHCSQNETVNTVTKNTVEEGNPEISYQEEIILETGDDPVTVTNNNAQSNYLEEIVKDVCNEVENQQIEEKAKYAKMITTKKPTPVKKGQKKNSLDFNPDEKLICILCGKKFVGADSLKSHMAVHTGGRGYRCKVCDKGFESNANLRQHERIHLPTKPYSCHICDKKFTRKWILQAHVNFHLGNRPYECDVCHKGFITRSSLNLHRSFHGSNKYKCDICGKEFTRPNSLKIHTNLHTGKDLFDCLVCGKKFGKRSHVTRHMKVHSADKPERKKIERKPRTPKEKKIIKCEICDKEFPRTYHLNRHLKSHEKKAANQMENDKEKMLVSGLSLTRKSQTESGKGDNCDHLQKNGEMDDDESVQSTPVRSRRLKGLRQKPFEIREHDTEEEGMENSENVPGKSKEGKT